MSSMQCVKCSHDRVMKNGWIYGKAKMKCKAFSHQFAKGALHNYQPYHIIEHNHTSN